MGVSKDSARSAEDIQSTPLPGETLAMFYARSRASTLTALLMLYLLNLIFSQVNTGHRRHLETVTVEGSSYVEMGLRSQKSATVCLIFLWETHFDHMSVSISAAVYKPILREVEKILQEAGLDEEEMRKGAAAGPPTSGGSGSSRYRK